MEHKILILGIILALFSSSCKAPAYLPDTEDIGVNEFGSFIIVDLQKGSNVEGELIAIERDAIIVLAHGKETNKIQTIPVTGIKTFKLMYAQPKNYGWTIPVSALVTLSHGYLAIATAPANLIVTSIVTARGHNAFTYSEEDMSWEKLKMFARFPQGLPANVQVADID